MKIAFVALMTLHGLIHLMGPAKAFGVAELAELSTPISRPMGLVWLAAALALLAAAALLAVSWPHWWAAGLVALLLSQAVIVSAWGDARFGTLANVLVLAGVVYGLMSQGPPSLAAEYRRQLQARPETTPSPAVLTESDLAPLPEPVRRYLRLTGAVGQPVPHHVRATWRGRIRAGPDDPWMTFTAEQYSVPAEPARFFLMDARKGLLPVDVLHDFSDGAARMRVRLLSLIPVADAHGQEMTRAETVTLLNDMALFIPGALADPRLRGALRWEAVGDDVARVSYAVGANDVDAELRFNARGELVDFVSEDRLAASADGSRFVRMRWSTPVSDYRRFGELRVMSRGEGVWHGPDGAYSYLELELLELETGSAGTPRR